MLVEDVANCRGQIDVTASNNAHNDDWPLVSSFIAAGVGTIIWVQMILSKIHRINVFRLVLVA